MSLHTKIVEIIDSADLTVGHFRWEIGDPDYRPYAVGHPDEVAAAVIGAVEEAVGKLKVVGEGSGLASEGYRNGVGDALRVLRGEWEPTW